MIMAVVLKNYTVIAVQSRAGFCEGIVSHCEERLRGVEN